MTSIRTSVHDLHDESVNLRESVEGLISEFQFCPVSLDYDMGLEIPREVKYCFISIVKRSAFQYGAAQQCHQRICCHA